MKKVNEQLDEVETLKKSWQDDILIAHEALEQAEALQKAARHNYENSFDWLGGPREPGDVL